MMTRKHFQRVADLLAGEQAIATTDEVRHALNDVTYSLADLFKQDNARFDRERFYAAARLAR